MDKVRMGIIGCGKMASMAHGPALQKLHDDGAPVEVTAVCDLDIEKANTLGEKFGCKIYTDYKAMVDDVDAVLIVTNHETHYEIAKFFMSHNKQIMLEKPLCNTREEIVDLIEDSEKRDLTFMCAYPVPFWQAVEKLRELLKTGEYGNVIQMSIWTEQYTRPMTKDWKIIPDAIRTKKDLGGGQLFSHGCHYIDIMLEFLGDPEYGVHVGTNTGTPWMEGEGHSNVTIKFKNGTMGYHFGTWGAKGSFHGYTFHVLTDEGMFEYRADDETLEFSTNRHPEESKRTSKKWFFPITTFHATWREIAHFVECVCEHKEPLTNPRRALRGLDLIWKLYEAEEKGVLADLSDL